MTVILSSASFRAAFLGCPASPCPQSSNRSMMTSVCVRRAFSTQPAPKAVGIVVPGSKSIRKYRLFA